nr:P-loop NTPase fold protein [uncultured Flavobacterium sp.]
MNAEQVEIIKQYLNIETNYAVIINGQYGVGKTHFYKNYLSPKIKEVSLSKDERKKYTPIHISLFGFKSLDEIQTAIFVELYPILKNKGLKLAAGIGKSLIRGIAQIKGVGEIDQYIGDITQDADDWLKYDELVICFDDLDRKSEGLDLRDVFGFINSLVENQGVKILIIANEEQLIKDEHYSSSLREKVIGVSIQFEPDVQEVYKQIIETRYATSSKSLFKFLEANSSRIVETIQINQNNFRNLVFFLEHLKTIYYPLENEFQVDKDFNLLKEEKLQSVLNFTIAIAIEYKLGLINSTNFEDIKELGINAFAKFDINLFIQNNKKVEKEERTPTYIEVFRNKYFTGKKYYFFKSIFDYITGTRSFCIETLKSELMGYFIVENGKVPEQDIILNDLSYFSCLKLSDEQYKDRTSKMLEFVDNGKYQLRQYSTVFHYATRFNNILGYNFKNLQKRFKKGIKNGVSNYKYDYDLGFHISLGSDTEFKDEVQEVVNYCLEINDTLEKNNNESELKELFNLFQNDYDSFIEKVTEQNYEFRLTPFWLEFNLGKVSKTIENLDNEKIWKLGHYFQRRYRIHIYDKIYPEKEFVIKLRESINQNTRKRKVKSLKNASLDYLTKSLSDCERNFPE